MNSIEEEFRLRGVYRGMYMGTIKPVWFLRWSKRAWRQARFLEISENSYVDRLLNQFGRFV